MSAAGPAPDPGLPSPGLDARVQRQIERAMIAARWFMAPIYIGLFGALLLVVVKFLQKLFAIFPKLLEQDSNETMLAVLSLLDLALVGNLIVMVVLAGWENFISRLDPTDRPDWMGAMDFSSMKLKLVGSVTVIAAVYTLETFMHLKGVPASEVMWGVIILLTLGVTGVLLALMDRLGGKH